jgi:hypothetical protein
VGGIGGGCPVDWRQGGDWKRSVADGGRDSCHPPVIIMAAGIMVECEKGSKPSVSCVDVDLFFFIHLCVASDDLPWVQALY